MIISISLTKALHECRVIKHSKNLNLSKLYAVDGKGFVEIVFDPEMSITISDTFKQSYLSNKALVTKIKKSAAATTDEFIYAIEIDDYDGDAAAVHSKWSALNAVLKDFGVMALCIKIYKNELCFLFVRNSSSQFQKLISNKSVVPNKAVPVEPDIALEPTGIDGQHALINEPLMQHNVVGKKPGPSVKNTVAHYYPDHEYTKILKTKKYNQSGDEENFNTSIVQNAITNLEKSSGLHINEIVQVIKHWSLTSSLTLESLKLQRAVAHVFSTGINSHLQSRLQGNVGLDTEPESKHYKIVEAIYKETQKRFEAAGLKKILLYRGMGVLKYTDGDSVVSVVESIETNPASSFSNSFTVARKFAAIQIDPYARPIVYGAYFPVDRILSMPATGIGCHTELEFVVLGGNYKVYADPLIFTGIARLSNILDFKQTSELDINDILDQKKFKVTRLALEADEPIIIKDLKNIAPHLSQKGKPLDCDTLIKYAKGLKKLATEISISSDSTFVDDDKNADWIKRTWNLPKYGTPEFKKMLVSHKLTLAEFKTLPIYRYAVAQGTIKERHEN